MALANWAAFAVDLQGRPCRARLAAEVAWRGSEAIALRKNYLDLHDPYAWMLARTASSGAETRMGFVAPIVGQVHAGTVRYKRLHVRSLPCDHASGEPAVCALAWTGDGPDLRAVALIGGMGHASPTDPFVRFADADGWMGVPMPWRAYLDRLIEVIADDLPFDPAVMRAALRDDRLAGYNQAAEPPELAGE